MSKTYTAEQKAEYAEQKRNEQREMLASAVERMCSSEGWQNYLDARSRFYNYSFFNTILIAWQKPDASQIASAKKWREEFKRQIIKGQKAIRILAPVIVYLKDDAGQIVRDDEGKKMIKFVWYKGVPVFDVSQTEGEPVPAIPLEPITGDSHEEFLLRTEQWIESLGASVTRDNVEFHWTQGDEGRRLTAHIDASKPINSQVRDMVRAAASICGTDLAAGYEESLTAKQQEVIIESAAYITCQNIGLDTAGMSIPYIASWDEEDPKKVLAIVKGFAAKIDEAVEIITEAIS